MRWNSFQKEALLKQRSKIDVEAGEVHPHCRSKRRRQERVDRLRGSELRKGPRVHVARRVTSRLTAAGGEEHEPVENEENRRWVRDGAFL